MQINLKDIRKGFKDCVLVGLQFGTESKRMTKVTGGHLAHGHTY